MTSYRTSFMRPMPKSAKQNKERSMLNIIVRNVFISEISDAMRECIGRRGENAL
jgi:hypothetical protein